MACDCTPDLSSGSFSYAYVMMGKLPVTSSGRDPATPFICPVALGYARILVSLESLI